MHSFNKLLLTNINIFSGVWFSFQILYKMKFVRQTKNHAIHIVTECSFIHEKHTHMKKKVFGSRIVIELFLGLVSTPKYISHLSLLGLIFFRLLRILFLLHISYFYLFLGFCPYGSVVDRMWCSREPLLNQKRAPLKKKSYRVLSL